jgi:ribonuclease P protein component
MPHRFTHPRSHRLSTRADFAAVYDAKVRDPRGPLLIYARPNGKDHLRLGFSTSRKVGIAVKRNRIRRLLREAFRLSHDDFPSGYDVLIVVKPHEPLKLDEYKELLFKAINKLDAVWRKRSGNGATPPLPPASGESS